MTTRLHPLAIRTAAIAALIATSVVLFLTAPTNGQFFWSDAPRHALNGLFLRDLMLAMPLGNIKEWAVDYYLQYPALTIMFYPPGLATAEMAAYFLFGDSHATAVAVVCAFHAALVVGAFVLASRWISFWQAWSSALLLAGLPVIALWTRQPMTDIPAFAFLTWSAVLLVRHLETGRPRHLYFAAALFVAGLYTKQSIIFLAPVALVLLWQHRGMAFWKDRHTWIMLATAALSLLPLAFMTIEFGQGNVQSVVSIDDAQVSRLSLSGWLYYATLLPRQIGWAVIVLSVAYIAGALINPRWRLPKDAMILLCGWVLAGYLFFSAIDLKDDRLDLFIMLPIAIFAILAINRILSPRWATPAALAFSVASFGYMLAFAPVPLVTGYQQAAEWIAENTPQDSIVAFSGRRDGAFIYDLRLLDPARQRRIVRVDKLLLGISIRRELDVVEKESDPSAIIQMMNEYGISYVVAERDFWTDLKPMAAFQRAIDTENFAEVARIPVVATIPHTDKELRIYRSLLPPPAERKPLTIDLPIIGRGFKERSAVKP